MTSPGLILSVDKPVGCTSFDVVQLIRRTLGWKAVGHAGTLDPSATGVLLVLCGDATRRTNEFMDLGKEYLARIRFGFSTSTDDYEGEVLDTRPVSDWSIERISEALARFVGRIEQIPPSVSAVKIGGRPSYKRSQTASLQPLTARPVEIREINLLHQHQPEITIQVRCSRGTYIRSLARDLGRQLGWGGTLAELRRTAIGPFRCERALRLQDILARQREFSQS